MTNEQKHTPGPWEFVPAGVAPVVQQAGAFPHGFICNVGSQNFVADARLIAAAPDMLAMLKVAQLWLDADGRFDMQGINAAIAKAEGKQS